MLNKIIALVGFLLIPNIPASATGWTSYTNTDAVRQILAANGRIWGATSGGAVSLIAATGDIEKLTNTDGLASIDMRCLESDTSSYLWFGAGDGWLTRYSPSGEIRNFAFRDSVGLIARPITIFDFKNDGDHLWVASDIGVSKFMLYSNGGEIRDTARRLGNLASQEDAVCVDVISGNLWIGTPHGIAFINSDNANIQYYGNWRSFASGENGLLNSDIRSIVSFQDTILAGTAAGVFKFVTSPDTAWVSFGLNGNAITRLYYSGDSLLASTNSGLYQYSSSGWLVFSSNGLQDQVNDFTRDPNGSLWAGTASSGIAEFVADSWMHHSIPGPASNFILKLAIDSSGGIWMTHNSKGLSRLADEQWSIFNSANSDPDGGGPLQGLLDNDAVSISVAPNGYVWVGSFGGGLYRYDWTSWYRWNYQNSPMYGVPGNHAYWAATAVLADSRGDIWISAFGSDSLLLMGVYDPNSPDSSWQLFHASDVGLFTNFVQVLRPQGNNIWVGRGDGLDKLNNGGTPFDISDDNWQIRISNNNITDMEIDPLGTLWLGAVNGLFFVPASADTAINIELPPTISGSVNAVASDGVGNIWVGTVAGLGVLRPNRQVPWQSSWQAIYTTSNSPILNNKINDLAIDIQTARVYIATDGGLSIFDSGILPPTADLSDMNVYPNPVILSNGDQRVEFKRVPSDGTLTIYTAAGDMVARFELSQRNYWDLKNSRGERIAGGIYLFHVRSGDASGTGKFAVIK